MPVLHLHLHLPGVLHMGMVGLSYTQCTDEEHLTPKTEVSHLRTLSATGKLGAPAQGRHEGVWLKA